MEPNLVELYNICQVQFFEEVAVSLIIFIESSRVSLQLQLLVTQQILT